MTRDNYERDSDVTFRTHRVYFFGLAAFTLPCLWIPIVNAGVFPLVAIALATLRFPHSAFIVVLNAFHVLIYAAIELGLASVAARLLSEVESVRSRRLAVATLTLVCLIIAGLPLWGFFRGHSSRPSNASAPRATLELLLR